LSTANPASPETSTAAAPAETDPEMETVSKKPFQSSLVAARAFRRGLNGRVASLQKSSERLLYIDSVIPESRVLKTLPISVASMNMSFST
jgi:hypothetical protein